MNIFEKIYALLAIVFASGLFISLIYFPVLRQFHILLPICLVGLAINVGLLFVVLRDIFSRRFTPESKKYIWIALVLCFWPSIVLYLPKYGFQPRPPVITQK